MLFICYPNCSTCKKAENYLKDQSLTYAFRDIKKDHPTETELKKWLQLSDLPIRKFFNTSGQGYRQLNLKDKLNTMTEEEQIALLASDGMLVKRPILIHGDVVLVGFKESEWQTNLINATFIKKR